LLSLLEQMHHMSTTFRRLHSNTVPLRLPNAWDAASARLFESQGASAIATTSAGVSWALGYRDGCNISVNELVAAAARIARVLTVPLSIDMENGYSDEPKAVAEHVNRLIDLGIAGINIEDGLDSADLLASKIEAIRGAASKAGADLFVNARCDVFLASLVEKSKLVEESIARGKTYTRAGADGLFLPGIVQAQDIMAVVDAVSVPLNVMAWPSLADAAELGKIGVRRLSAGSAISQVLWGRAARLARDFLDSGRSGPLSEASMPYAELQELFAQE
jgi:2-methylisocitrate lyase-like PEP mutase family enzyme